MRLTTNELKLFREVLLARKSYYSTVSQNATVWEEWMQGTLDKLTDELYPQEFDVI